MLTKHLEHPESEWVGVGGKERKNINTKAYMTVEFFDGLVRRWLESNEKRRKKVFSIFPFGYLDEKKNVLEKIVLKEIYSRIYDETRKKAHPSIRF